MRKLPASTSWHTKAEQQALRREYLDDIKASLRAQLNNTSIQEPDGTIHKLAKKD